MGRRKMRRGFWRGNVKERDHLEDLDVDGRLILNWIVKKYDGMDYINLAQNGTSGRLLRAR
jgi:hypothetical protein